jgi:hypothetical protein
MHGALPVRGAGTDSVAGRGVQRAVAAPRETEEACGRLHGIRAAALTVRHTDLLFGLTLRYCRAAVVRWPHAR